MKELANQYKQSAEPIKKRISELTRLKEFLEARTKNPEINPEIIAIKERLGPLKNMLKDMTEITKEIEHYYDRWWWRSEKYTLNQRKVRKFIYVEPIYDDPSDECEKERRDEKIPESIYGSCTDW